jgi:hypothetical protein
MTRETALERLARMTAASTAPELSNDELETLLVIAARVDRDGHTADAEGWEPTYDLNAAAAEGWRWKGAAAAACIDVSTDGTNLRRSQVHEHCMRVAAHYAARIATGTVVVSTVDEAWIDAAEGSRLLP